MPPVGPDGIDTRGLDVSDEDMAKLLGVDAKGWHGALPQFHEFFARFSNIPDELHDQLKALEERLG